ncbi:winged helix-turn-helix domain-containing protein [Glaciihabitans sp. dw_435]|uniref:winged helix-turn-helix domain-containing protein n=1 Tax=Glaciihabitans sp. dw_435 TaxID=2720081 RepID=UPI001BD69B96|nr:winged helix-turn-helix domain-containing protein [Glaciihabitans sp. dw_435]
MAEFRSTNSSTDVKRMRVLAHPQRLRLLGELRVRGPQTVGLLSEIVDNAPGSVSYHLGKLAEFGFVVEAPELARDKRERWWRAAHDVTHIDAADSTSTPDVALAQTALRLTIYDSYHRAMIAALEREATLSDEWIGATSTDDIVTFLTADDVRQMTAEVHALMQRWSDRSAPEADGAEAVVLLASSFRRG